MKSATVFVTACLLVNASSVRAGDSDCTFDQTGVRAALLEIAARHPGFQRDDAAHAVFWHEPSGRTVTLSYGGCVDLGVDIGIKAPDGPHPGPTLDELLAAVRNYWSARAADAITTILASGSVHQEQEGDTILIEAGRFPHNFEIRLEAREASIGWQEL